MRRLLTLSAALLLFSSVALQADDFNPVLPPEPQTSYQITVGTADPNGATVSGAGWYPSGKQVHIVCTLAENYRFRYWTLNGDSCTDRSSFVYTVENKDAHFMAYVQYIEPTPVDPVDTITPEPPFDPSLPGEPDGGPQVFTSRVHLTAVPTEAGYFSHTSGNEYKEDSTVTFCAYANENYVLEGWYQNDERISQQECLEVTIPIKDVSLVAKYRLIDNPIYRSYLYVRTNLTGACTFNIISGNQYIEGSKVIISRTTTSEHEWLGWYIGETLLSTDTSFVYTTGRSDVTIWAMYREVFNPSLPDDPSSDGTEVDNRPTVMIEAPFKEGWIFDHWNDGVTTNPRSVLLEDKDKYYPIYIPGTYMTQVREDICEGSSFDFNGTILTKEGIYRDTLKALNTGDSIIVLNLYVHPTYEISEDVEIMLGDSFLLGDQYYYTSGTYQATFISQYGCDSVRIVHLSVQDTTQYYTLLVHSADSTRGRVTGSGLYAAYSLVAITATEFEGYYFTHWNDESTENPRFVQITQDTEYTAFFEVRVGTDIQNQKEDNRQNARKIIQDGRFFILRDGQTYNAQGYLIR